MRNIFFSYFLVCFKMADQMAKFKLNSNIFFYCCLIFNKDTESDLFKQSVYLFVQIKLIKCGHSDLYLTYTGSNILDIYKLPL